MNNNLLKVDVKDSDIPFIIPYGIYILQYFLNILFTSFLLLFPLLIVIISIYITHTKLTQLIIIIALPLFLVIYVIMYLFFFEESFTPKFKFYKKFKSYYLRKFIMKKINCPKCQNKINSYKSKIPTAQYYYDYSYFCGSCKTGFSLYKISEKTIRPRLVLRESKNKKKKRKEFRLLNS